MFGFGKKPQPTTPPPPPAPPKPALPSLTRLGAKDAQARIAAGAVLLDVREDVELQIASVKGALHIPMGQIQARLGELDKGKEIVCMCHHGMRSEGVAEFLRENGFTLIANLEGGIAAWASEVDPSVPQY